MKFDEKDLLKAMGLEIGDKIKCNNSTYKIIKNKHGIVFVPVKGADRISTCGAYFINKEFKKVEHKIWTVDTYELGEDKAYYIDMLMSVDWFRVNHEVDLNFITDNITFTKRKYAEEYLEELKKFNKQYKEESSE